MHVPLFIIRRATRGGVCVKATHKWEPQEIRVQGPKDGNPYVDHWISMDVEGPLGQKSIPGFYDGDGEYVVRFMPEIEGMHQLYIHADFLSQPISKCINVQTNRKDFHGPVHVCGTHFVYEDGTPYFSVGTTCYVWLWQNDDLIAQTLETLRNGPFNKIRFCVFPKHYPYNLHEPRSYPYPGRPMDSSVLTDENFMEYGPMSEGNEWQTDRFNPEHFRHLETCVEKLMELGIEADIIIFHPYDRWGFSVMDRESDLLYIRYLCARLSAYPNVWWSLANEYDLLSRKSIADWEMIAREIVHSDPYGHLRSIHHCRVPYDASRRWITHVSWQRTDLYKSGEVADELIQRYSKPVVMDEIAYEGNIQYGWGNITGEELVRRFWETAVRGGYPGHGETFLSNDHILWWSHGGMLHGESPARIAFLRDVMQDVPGGFVSLSSRCEWDEVRAEAGKDGEWILCYYSFMRPSFREFHMSDDTEYQVDVIDTWNMTIQPMGIFHGRFNVPLPGKQYMAIRLRRVE